MKRSRPRSGCSAPAAAAELLIVVLFIASSCSAEPLAFHRTPSLHWRGGDATNEDAATLEAAATTAEDEAPKQQRKAKFWNIASLFELNSEAQEGALEVPEEEPLPPGNGRGGALAVVATKPKRRFLFQTVDVVAGMQDEATTDNDDTANPMHKLLHIKDEPKDEREVPTEEEVKDEPKAEEEEPVEEEVSEDDIEEPAEAVLEDEEEDDDMLVEESEETKPENETKSLFSIFSSKQKPVEEVEEEPKDDNDEKVDDAASSPKLLWWGDAWDSTFEAEVPPHEEEEEAVEDVEVEVPSHEEEEAVEGVVFEITEEVKQEEASHDAEVGEEDIFASEKASDDILVEEVDIAPEKPLDDALAEEDSSVPEKISKPEKKKKMKKAKDGDWVIPLDKETPRKKKKKKQKKAKVEEVVEEISIEAVEEISIEAIEDDSGDEQEMGPAIVIGESQYISSGSWTIIDNIATLGLATNNPALRVSRHLRGVRKAAAKATGLHGVLSGKNTILGQQPEEEVEDLDDEDMGQIQRRLAAIERARKSVQMKQEKEAEVAKKQKPGLFRRRRRERRQPKVKAESPEQESAPLDEKSAEEEEDAQQRRARVRDIDREMSKTSERLHELACEKDELQQRPNPLFNYTTSPLKDGDKFKFGRRFNFPQDSLVEDYLDDMFANGRLIKLNHTDLWRSGVGFDDDEDENIGDDLLTPSAHANRLYKEKKKPKKRAPSDEKRHETHGNGGGGSWLLRQSIGKGGSLGEKIGEAAEVAGYKAVCAAVMSTLARAISGIHGINIMTHSDIRLTVEQVPDLPPISKNALPRNDYAQEAIKEAMLKGRRGKKKFSQMTEAAFLQRDAVVETLLSHCQISAPLLKLFPLAWQRALLANMITLITHVISDFCDGIELQILGHSLTFSFKPITESDMIRHIGLAGKGFNHRRARPEEFEAAVRATAEDLADELHFLDRWHERALGSGMLRAQIANLIARIVLTLTDEVLSGARMDLWAAQAGGPRVVAGLEYRTTPSLPRQEEEFVN